MTRPAEKRTVDSETMSTPQTEPVLSGDVDRDTMCRDIETFRSGWEEFTGEKMSTAEAAAAILGQYEEPLKRGETSLAEFQAVQAALATC